MVDFLTNCAEADFLSFLKERLPSGYGERVALASPRVSYPLILQRARRLIAHRFALVGDAWHVIHPLAGQGLNLGLRDAMILAKQVSEAIALGLSPGDSTVLESYHRLRLADVGAFLGVTHGLNSLFSNESRFLKRAARLGFGILNHMTPLKRMATRHAMGVVGVPGLQS